MSPMCVVLKCGRPEPGIQTASSQSVAGAAAVEPLTEKLGTVGSLISEWISPGAACTVARPMYSRLTAGMFSALADGNELSVSAAWVHGISTRLFVCAGTPSPK
jgi:hypothetical protein